jgi:hypothetical protein
MRMAEREIIIRTIFQVLKKYNRVVKGNCEPISHDISLELRKNKMPAHHVVGNFILDKPEANKYMKCANIKILDSYQVNHDWVEVGPFIIDATIKQFQPSVKQKLPEVGFLSPNDNLCNRYVIEKKYV